MYPIRTLLEKARNVFFVFGSKFLSWARLILSGGKKNATTANNGAVNGYNNKLQSDLDKKLVYSLTKSRVPGFKQLKYLKKFLTKRELLILRVSLAILFLSLIFVAGRFVYKHLQILPTAGGEYIEGLVGAPQHINPLYAGINDVDNDINRLVFSSLLIRDKDGELVNDLIKSYTLSSDNKIYSFVLKPDIKWHDGTPLTVDDVVFTFNTLKDSQYKSPLRSSFSGVEIVKVDEQKFNFVLTDPYAAFLELLTFGIMPANLWSQIPAASAPLAELNLKPIGSGPYKYLSLTKDKSGNIKGYELEANKNYYGQVPYVNIKFKFYLNFEEAVAALNAGAVDGLSYLPQEYKKDIITPGAFNYNKLSLPQLTVLFFNQNGNVALADKKVRQALAYAMNKQEIVNKVLLDDAYVIDGPILPSSFAYNKDAKKYTYNQTEADKLLTAAGWKTVTITPVEVAKSQQEINSTDEKVKVKAGAITALGAGQWREKNGKYLIIKITTIDRIENGQILSEVKNYWEKVGVKTEIEILPTKDIGAQAIKPRNFEVLYYGQVVGGDPDLYVFWHSSQADNGFNIVNFKNKEADQLLEDARLVSDKNIRREKYYQFQNILAEELPAIFMYSPVYTYAQNKDIKGFSVKNILVPRDRFANIKDWYINTSKKIVW